MVFLSVGRQHFLRKELVMLRFPKPALLVLICVALIGCQKYTSGLVQTAGRADEAVVLSNLRSIMAAENAYNLAMGDSWTHALKARGPRSMSIRTQLPCRKNQKVPGRHHTAAMPIPNALEIARDGLFISTQ